MVRVLGQVRAHLKIRVRIYTRPSGVSLDFLSCYTFRVGEGLLLCFNLNFNNNDVTCTRVEPLPKAVYSSYLGLSQLASLKEPSKHLSTTFLLSLVNTGTPVAQGFPGLSLGHVSKLGFSYFSLWICAGTSFRALEMEGKRAGITH